MDHFEQSGLQLPSARLAGHGDGETVVLLHGFPQQPSSYDHIARRLNDAGLRTVGAHSAGLQPECDRLGAAGTTGPQS